MAYSSNIEPRRSWRRPQRESYWLGLETGACMSCGESDAVSYRRGAPFCRQCIDWSAQSELDDDYDDLGLAG